MTKASEQLTPENFIYVDARSGESPQWQRIELKNIANFQQTVSGNHKCFATVQRYANSVQTDDEPYIMPMFFDFDVDVSDSEEALKIAQQDVQKVINFLTTELDAKETDIKLYFSGNKGFHLIVNPIAVGIDIANDTHKVLKHACGYLKYRLNLESLDMVVYSSKRMLRLPNSLHEKSQLHKVELSFKELNELSVAEIKELAKRPRVEPVIPNSKRLECLGVRTQLKKFYSDKRTEYLTSIPATSTRDKTTYHFDKEKKPACVEDLLENGWKADGLRNNTTVSLACYFKEAGYTIGETLDILTAWVKKHTSAKRGYEVEARVANTKNVVHTIFSEHNNYRFGCAFIRGLHGKRTPGQKDYDRVKCHGDLCPALGAVRLDEDAPLVHLASTGRAEYNGRLIKTRVMVAGKRQTPYIVPQAVEYYCFGYKNCKKLHCPLHDVPNHVGYKNLSGRNRELIQMTATTDKSIKEILADMSEIPYCHKYNTEITETINVDELLVIPMAEEGEKIKQEEGAGRYVLRKVYAAGDIEVAENKYYELSGFVFPNPKTQESTLLLQSARPLQDVVDSFTLTDEVKSELRVFSPSTAYASHTTGVSYTAEDIERRLSELCTDLTYNVTRIIERDETLLAVLLTYHSVLRLHVPWQATPIRGWLECVVLGDTGTGKSALIDGIQRFIKLGSYVNAEVSSRTGVTYKMEQQGSGGAWYIVWGAWPLADRELLWIDEASGIAKEAYGEMTAARSDGKLAVKRAVTAETPCRVRCIMSGNVKSGKDVATLDSYPQGAVALQNLFNNEDIRRFDFGIFMKRGDVDPDSYNKVLQQFPTTITPTALKNNVLFAWSRTPEQVKFTAPCIEAILATSTKLSKRYGSAGDVPLVSPSDQRNKVARLATALASLLHSVDETGENIIVDVPHVEFIEQYLCAIYNSTGCGLNFLATMSDNDGELTPKRYEKIKNTLRTLKILSYDGTYKEVINLFATAQYLTVRDLEDLLNLDKEDAKSIAKLFMQQKLVVKSTSGFKKTPLFNRYISRAFQEGLFNQDEDDE